MFDLRLLTGPVMLVAGGVFLFMALRLWWVRPLNRVFRLGPFVTERGMKALLNLRFTSFALGAFLLVQGLTSVTFWYIDRDVNDPLVQLLGSLGAGLGFWTGALLLIGMWRLWRLD